MYLGIFSVCALIATMSAIVAVFNSEAIYGYSLAFIMVILLTSLVPLTKVPITCSQNSYFRTTVYQHVGARQHGQAAHRDFCRDAHWLLPVAGPAIRAQLRVSPAAVGWMCRLPD